MTSSEVIDRQGMGLKMALDKFHSFCCYVVKFIVMVRCSRAHSMA